LRIITHNNLIGDVSQTYSLWNALIRKDLTFYFCIVLCRQSNLNFLLVLRGWDHEVGFMSLVKAWSLVVHIALGDGEGVFL